MKRDFLQIKYKDPNFKVISDKSALYEDVSYGNLVDDITYNDIEE